MFHSLSLPLLLLIFVAAAVAIWFAGIQLSNTTDVLSARLGLGQALGGLILLAIATNLPEIAITVSAALSLHLGLAIGNILSGYRAPNGGAGSARYLWTLEAGRADLHRNVTRTGA
jgi:cation:H+ antiporter